MAQLTDIIHEGVKKNITITIDSDAATRLDGLTATLYAFLRGPGTEVELGSAVISGVNVLFTSTNTDDLAENKVYEIEAWVNPDLETRECIYPQDADDHYFQVKDREKIE